VILCTFLFIRGQVSQGYKCTKSGIELVLLYIKIFEGSQVFKLLLFFLLKDL